MERKEKIIALLYSFAAQRPGIETMNYGSYSSYRSESRQVTRDLHDANRLIRECELRPSITADDLLNAAKHAYSGRLTIIEREDGKTSIDYCTGQYFATEYRRAVCAVCSSALWDRKRQDMPQPFKMYGGDTDWYALKTSDAPPKPVSAGTWMRESFKREFGHRLASRYFD